MTDPAGYPHHRVNRIVAAVETMETSLGILVEKSTVDRETYHNEADIRDIVERRFVKLSEAALDIVREILRAERGSVPESNAQVMAGLEEVGISGNATTDKMVEAARFRNVLAHTYGHHIDDDAVYAALQDLERYRWFLQDIRAHLGEAGVLD